jgi:adenylate cyclase
MAAVARKLATILASDVVAYSRLAGADEERTLVRLRALRSNLIHPIVSVHHGRIVKRRGDGALVEFRSVVDAVRCSLAPGRQRASHDDRSTAPVRQMDFVG